MSAANPCDCACPNPTTVAIPGSPGISAFSFLTAPFTIPAIGASAVANVTDNSWMGFGQPLFLSSTTSGVVTTIGIAQAMAGTTQVTIKNTGANGTTAAGFVVDTGGIISPAGTEQSITLPLSIANGGTGQITAPAALSALLSAAPLPIANGGTAGATKAAAISALGVGQVATVFTGAGLAYTLTNTPAQITGVTVTVPSTGSYLVLAMVTVLYTGTTFVASRTLTLTVRNTTDSANVLSCARDTNIFTTTSQPSLDYVLPFTVQALTSTKVLQLWASLDTVASAGTSVITAASLCILPIAI